MSDSVPKSETDLREMVYHTDARVTAMEGQLDSIAHSLSRTDTKIDQVIHAINAPKDINWVGIGALCISMIVAMFGGARGMVEYVTITQAPILSTLDEHSDVLSHLREFQQQTHYEFGQFSTKAGQLEKEVERLWAHIHKQEDVDTVQNEKIAKAEISRRAMGDYIRQIDELGSRRWVGDRSKASRVDPSPVE